MENQKNIKILIATHKLYEMPTDPMYLPIHVGKKGKEEIGFIGDETGENISEKNPYYCELTALYWAWRNLNADYIGLAHYRRHFSYRKKSKKTFENVLTYSEASSLLENVDVIVPKKRKYYIENLYDHYAHTHYVEHLIETRKIIEKDCAEYLRYFDKLKNRTSAHMFNMFIMKKEIFDNYGWLFSILEKLEDKIDIEKYDAYQARFFGRISELLLDVYLEKNNIKYEEIGFIYMEKINWKRKIKSFLKARFGGEKYEGSF